MHRSTTSRPMFWRPSGSHRHRRWTALAVTLAVTAAALLAPGVAASATTAAPADQWTGVDGTAGSSSTNAGEHVLTASDAGRIREVFAARNRSEGAEPPVVLGGVVYTVGGTTAPKFYAASAKTGKVLWSIAAPYTLSSYGFGMTGAGSTILVAFRTSPAGGVLAVNTAKHTISWRAFFPASTTAGVDRTYPGAPTTDGSRVFIAGSSNAVNAYSIATGAFLWGRPYTSNGNGGVNAVTGFAAGGGTFYTNGGEGLVAYNASTGKRTWKSSTGIAYGPPVLAGGRVFINESGLIQAYPAGGCGTVTCRPSWSTSVDSYDLDAIGIAGADSSSLFLSYRTQRPGGPTQCASGFIGHIARLSAVTGKTQWQTSVGDYGQGIVRGGDVIWMVNEYVNSKCETDQYRLLAYSATATGSTPLASLAIASPYCSYPQSLAVASGTVFQTPSNVALVGYRVPGT